MPAKKSSANASCKQSEWTSEDTAYEAERIIGHVTFEHAYLEYYFNNEKRYESIFTTSKDITRGEHDKYYYLIKWKNWREKDTTWECEENCSSMDYLNAYKQFNGLPKERIRLRGVPCSEVPGSVIIEEFEQKEDASDSEPQSYGFYPDDKSYNERFGMVRFGDCKELQQIKNTKEVSIYTMTNKDQKFVLVERDMKYVLKCNVPKEDSRNFENWQQEVQNKDKSYLSSVIQHPNSVKMLDYYFKSESSGKTPVYCYIYEYFEFDLEKKIAAKKMTVEKSKKLCADMLSLLSLLHTYGVHHNISKNHIYVDGDVYKLSHFEKFRLFKDSIDLDKVDESTLYYKIAYRPFERYGSLNENETTFDIYALGVVLLESLTNRSIKNKATTLQKSIEDNLARLDEPHRSMVSMMLNSREYIYEKNIPKYRYSAKSLLQHPWLTDNNFQFIKCVFLASYYSEPVDEMLFYNEDDMVINVVDRLTCLYSDSEDMHYQVLFTEALHTGVNFVRYIEDSDIFAVKVEQFKNLRLVIVPILKAKYTEPVQKSISFVYFPVEFGSVPIVIESAPMSDMDVCKTVIEQAFAKQDRGLPFVIRRFIPEHGKLNFLYKMCPRSLINERLKHTFPKTMDGDDYDIPTDPPQYCITIMQHLHLKDHQPETAEEANGYEVCEFSMSFGQLCELRECRFDPFMQIRDEINDVSFEEYEEVTIKQEAEEEY